METTEKGKGLYLGTEINGKWWKRYKKDKMFARGSGEYWFKDGGLYFLRYLTKQPIFIPFDHVKELKPGSWHAGQWCMGAPVIKFIWEKDGLELSSGFILTKRKDEALALIDGISKEINAEEH